jgi:hypothetical protein
MPKGSRQADTRKGAAKRAPKGGAQGGSRGAAKQPPSGERVAALQEDTVKPLLDAWKAARTRAAKNRIALVLRVELARRGEKADAWMKLLEGVR